MSLIALLACTEGGLMWAETWEVIGLSDDGALVDITFTRGNAGVWAGSGKVRGTVTAKDEGTVRYGMDRMADNVQVHERGLSVGTDRLYETGGAWTLELVEGNDLDGYRDLRGSLSDGIGRTEPVDMGDWTVQGAEMLVHMQGYARVGQRDRLLDGNAVVLHRHGERPPMSRGATRRAAFVLDDRLSVGVDQVGSQVLAWAVIDGVQLPADDAVLRIGDKAQVQLDFRPAADLIFQVEPRRPRVRSWPLEHLTGPELTGVDLWVGVPTRRLSKAIAIGMFEGQPLTSNALLLWSDPEDALARDEDGG